MQQVSSTKSASNPKKRRLAFEAFRRFSLTSLLVLTVLTLAACSNTQVPTPPATSATIFAFEAEGADVSNGVFAVVADVPASAEAALMQPASVSANREAREDASIRFDVGNEEQWTLWARLRADSRAGDSVFVGFNGEMTRVSADALGEYVWLRITSQELEQGQHRISLGHAEGRLKLDMLIVTNLSDATAADLETWRASNVPPASQVPTIEPQ